MAQKIVLTGATGRLGQELAFHLAGQGVELCLVGRNPVLLSSLKKKLETIQFKCHIICIDFLKEKSVETMVNRAEILMGGIDVFINNATMFGNKPFMASDIELIDNILEVNVRSVLHLVHHAVPVLKNSKHPKIINISSIAACQPKATLAVYSATKAAVHSFFQALRDEMKPMGIHACNLMLDQLTVDKSNTAGDDIPLADVIPTIDYLLNYSSTKSFPTEIKLQG